MSVGDHPAGPDPVGRAAIGPRRPGGVYRNGYLALTYRVEQILIGPAARELIPHAQFAITQTDVTGPSPGRWRVHCTAWNPRRDTVLTDPDPSPRSGVRCGGSEPSSQVAPGGGKPAL